MASAYPQLDVNYYVRGRLIGPLAATPVKVFDATNAVDLDDLTTDANGIIPSGELDVDPGTTVRFRVENHLGACGAWETVNDGDPVNELRVEARAGVVLVVSTEAQPLLRQATVEAALVQLYARYADEPVGTERYLGAVMPGGTLTREYDPDRDRDLVIAKISHSIDGVPDVAQMLDAEAVLLPINRMTAPELNQLTDAGHTEVSLGIKHHSHAKILRIEVSEHADLSGAEVSFREVPPGGIAALPLTRTSPGSGALTLYVRIAATAGTRYGAPSEIRSVTFANLAGTGGSGGSGGYPPGTIVPVEHAE